MRGKEFEEEFLSVLSISVCLKDEAGAFSIMESAHFETLLQNVTSCVRLSELDIRFACERISHGKSKKEEART